MKKVIVLLLAIVVVISSVFISCKKKDTADDNTTTEPVGIESADDEIGFEPQDVTDDKGKPVTDKNGNKVTTMVPVQYTTDKKGHTFGYVLDENGDKSDVTVSVKDTTTNKTTTNPTLKAEQTTTTTHAPTGTTKKNVPTTKNKETTSYEGTDSVPDTNATGKEISFSIEDQEAISSMLEVPYLYMASYENRDGVPISIAAHVAVWMAERDGGTVSIYPSSPVVLNLFKYFGQTVVNFKTYCNAQNTSGAPIKYINKDDTFEISGFTEKKQTVVISKIEDLGNNNYYKITGDVSNAGGKSKVVAIVQKNRLDSTLGFSIKALKWS